MKEDPPGSNRGPRVDVYLRAAGLDPARGKYPWCAAFVAWAIREAGLRYGPLRFRGSASVSLLLARNRGLAIAVGDAEEGDVLLHIHPKGNHCGFRAADTGPGWMMGLEGNTDADGSRTGGQVMKRARWVDYWTHALRTK